MPWTMDDYPQSWKNLDKLERKKAIDIGNAMLKDGYKEDRAIPIATKQAESWYKDATKEELEELQNKKITLHDKDDSANPNLNNQDVHVYFEEDVWKIKSEGAKQASDSFDKKEDAMKRARNIADNRQTEIIEHKKDE
ncbi:DUF2188 domain-containing protein [Staphylococcus gallinarum]|jgi:uncharacterized protein YdaT|uniref:DUF2188 domain-containing protein n=1 Tax=Staphylococcus gallinarum TaxID=1293 RepID=A0A2T4T0J4_STAGA|nr:DUF2188 domain-containing protein [Staphylococcus gallinarum]MCD8821328.1 DUF2188 domain-containing protein [Staphylococcus gallinarum]MCD8826846.1 DUF2188 domain-containing protein [Staphylococcus gallinarum]MCQ9288616.1 DUF2188 domain-containing protein [Staphylococcus gallinarum]MEB6243057.1 DUF2188 domain-containing protein [Staphylococcus gallinarum]MEB6296130.1 DUF2188 domain-containing protein [Staphylococcus gallinarum]